VTRCGGVMTLTGGGEVAQERKKGGDDASWTNANFTELKNEENPYG
jgi:hypothetical protein